MSITTGAFRTKWGRARQALGLILVLFLLGGCQMEASITHLGTLLEDSLSQRNAEFVSASSQKAESDGGYMMYSSIIYHSAMPEVQSSGGYRVMTSVQGSLVEDE